MIWFTLSQPKASYAGNDSFPSLFVTFNAIPVGVILFLLFVVGRSLSLSPSAALSCRPPGTSPNRCLIVRLYSLTHSVIDPQHQPRNSASAELKPTHQSDEDTSTSNQSARVARIPSTNHPRGVTLRIRATPAKANSQRPLLGTHHEKERWRGYKPRESPYPYQHHQHEWRGNR
jgi:hypothetical protein